MLAAAHASFPHSPGGDALEGGVGNERMQQGATVVAIPAHQIVSVQRVVGEAATRREMMAK
jgi:hypothetical protein